MKASGFRGCVKFDGARVTLRKGLLARPWLHRTTAFPLGAITGVMVGRNRFGLGEIRFAVVGEHTDRPPSLLFLDTQSRRHDRTAMTFLPWHATQFATLARAIQGALEELTVADELPPARHRPRRDAGPDQD